MAYQEFENGVPMTVLKSPEMVDRLQNPYGNFSGYLLHLIRAIDPQAPLDILTCGDNWLQLVVLQEQPHKVVRLTQHIEASLITGENWPIMGRRPTTRIDEIMGLLQEGVVSGSLDRRILERIAILDLTQARPVIDRAVLQNTEDMPWGVKGILPSTHCLVYHITSGYARQTAAKLFETPDRSVSAYFIQPGEIKW